MWWVLNEDLLLQVICEIYQLNIDHFAQHILKGVKQNFENFAKQYGSIILAVPSSIRCQR